VVRVTSRLRLQPVFLLPELKKYKFQGFIPLKMSHLLAKICLNQAASGAAVLPAASKRMGGQTIKNNCAEFFKFSVLEVLLFHLENSM